MEYSFFLGCTIPAREPSFEASARLVFKKLGVNLVDLKGALCCAPAPIESIDHNTSRAIAAYNIALAEESNLDLVTLCNGCFQALARTNRLLKEDVEVRADVNEVLSSIGKKYKGTIEVVDFLQVLNSERVMEKIKKSVSKPLKDVKVAVFYGCHALKPSKFLMLDDPDQPRILDDLVEITGAQSVPYEHKMKCCGGLLRGVSDDLARKLAQNKLFNVSQAKADCIVTICPFCHIQLDIGQLEVNRRFNEQYAIPVLHYPQLLGLSMGINPLRLGLQTHKVSTDSLLTKIK
ncbi:MAG: CoB--CoM heterodisulfide reductase subunit B [Candidatus Bathyarchaeia archaeon]